MSDQAARLRELIRSRHAPHRATKILTITSGKGGVGKSNFTLNFALNLQASGYKVLIFDADIGLANLDVLMGVHPRYNLYHLLKKEKTIQDIIEIGPGGLKFIAGGSGFAELFRLSEEDLEYFTAQIEELNGEVDFILFDTGAGLSKETLRFILASHESIIVTTPEPTAITDAYAIIKMVRNTYSDIRFRLVINRIANEREGKQTAEKIGLTARRFLDLEIPVLGYVEDDPHVTKAVKKQIPFSIQYPDSSAAKGVRRIAGNYLAGLTVDDAKQTGGMKGFLHRMIKLLS